MTAGASLPRRIPSWGQALLWLSVAALVYAAGPRPIALDDSYISLHSARVALSGAPDPVFGSPALTGVTSPLYVALLMGLLSMGLHQGVDALRAAAALGVAAQAAGLWQLSRRAGVRAFWLRAAFVASGCGSGLIWMNATNGLETGWAMALLIWMIAACPDRPLFVAVCAGLLPMLRPDLAPASLALFVLASWNRGWRAQAQVAALAVAAAAPLLLWVRADTGHWLPQTMQAKYLFQSEVCAPLAFKARRAGEGIVVGVLTMLPLSVGLLALGKDRIGRAGLLAMTCSLLAIAWTVPDSLSFNDFRYLFPIVVPWAAYGLASMLAHARGAAWPAAAALAFATVFWTLYVGSLRPDTSADTLAERRAVAAWIDANTPADAVLLVHDAGVVSEYAHRKTVDFVGLKTPASMATHAAITLPSCGARRVDAIVSIAEQSHADYLLMQNDWGTVLDVEPAARARGIALRPVRPSLVADWFGQNVYHLERSGQP